MDVESMQRVQGLLRQATAQDRNNQQQQHSNLIRNNLMNQATRNTLSPQSVSSQIQMTNVPIHTVSSQQGSYNSSSGGGAGDNDHHHPSILQNQNVNNYDHQSPNLNQSNINQRMNNTESPLVSDERDRQKRIDELKRRQAEFDENMRKREEEVRQQQQHMLAHQQQMQQLYQQQQQSNIKNQSHLHANMLRLDNLVIDNTNSTCKIQNKYFLIFEFSQTWKKIY